jgi:transcriptional regulator with XRE-family HTH domain
MIGELKLNTVDKYVDKNLAKALRLIRVFHNMSQYSLAQKLGVDRGHVNHIEKEQASLSLKLLSKYAEVFDIPASSILLFSEQLKSDDVSERVRVFATDKVLKLLGLVAATKDVGSES